MDLSRALWGNILVKRREKVRMEELISIIIPAYNVEEYIEKCLDSVLKQTYHNIELLVIDDGSWDCTGEICDRYAVQDKRVRIFHVENGGVSRARNTGLTEAHGKYIMFVDSDDFVSDDYVEKSYQTICCENADWGINGYYICYPNQKETNQIEQTYTGVFDLRTFGRAFPWLYQNYFLSALWNKIYRKHLITAEFHTNMALGEDLYFNLEYMENVSRISVGEACCYFYRNDMTRDTLTRRGNRSNLQRELHNFHKVMAWCKRFSLENIAEIQHMHVQSLISMLYAMGKKKEAQNEKRQIITELCSDRGIRSAMKSVKTISWKSELLRWLLCRGWSGGIYILLEAVRLIG